MEDLGAEDPRWIGQYRLLRRLGAGGMGRVFLAHSARGRTVAVKLVQSELARQPEFRRRFQQEVKAAQRVGGEWTAPVLDADTEAATPWVATGYIAGPSLHEVVARGGRPLPERSVRILANGLTRALKDIHRAGLVHRDLKPSNILITIDGPRVIDFGIARALETVTDGVLTRSGAVVGSPGFMSPEQVRGERVTPASDVFCLGSVLAFAGTGRQPFGTSDSGVHAVLYRIAQEEPDLTGLPGGLLDLVADCLRKAPEERPTLDQLLERTAGAEDEDPGEPWLPGSLVAQLGRHAVELLEAESPAGPPPLPRPPAPPMPPAIGPVGAGTVPLPPTVPPTAAPTPPPPAHGPATPPPPSVAPAPSTPPPPGGRPRRAAAPGRRPRRTAAAGRTPGPGTPGLVAASPGLHAGRSGSGHPARTVRRARRTTGAGAHGGPACGGRRPPPRLPGRPRVSGHSRHSRRAGHPTRRRLLAGRTAAGRKAARAVRPVGARRTARTGGAPGECGAGRTAGPGGTAGHRRPHPSPGPLRVPGNAAGPGAPAGPATPAGPAPVAGPAVAGSVPAAGGPPAGFGPPQVTSFDALDPTPPGGAPLSGGSPLSGGGHTPPGGVPPLGGVGHGGPGAPGGGPDPARRRRRRMLLAVSATVAAVIVAGVATFVLTRGGEGTDTAKDRDDKRTSRPADRSPSPSTAPEPSGSGSPAGTATRPATTGDIPDDYLGAWEGEIEEDGNPTGRIRRIVLGQGTKGSEVADALTSGEDAFCQETGTLKEVARDLLVIEAAETSTSIPEGSCSATGEQTLKLQADGSLTWVDSDSSATEATLRRAATDGDAVPSSYLGTWQATDAYGEEDTTFKLTIAQGAYGTTVATTLRQSNRAECEGGLRLVSTRDGLVLSTEDVTKSVPEDACTPVPAITLTADGREKLRQTYTDDNGEEQTQTFTRLE
ncbi:serine/threonine protein kinase [Streptomyces pactum]|uniref:non-specific serine/threonine protein kinase n=1 Tax=Streptomyces pactum TaxID=68249 RepID=A0ABS0NLW7_9ACTN|nr:serine/threonine-protein kinase [Streptomyces pactum]MBH5336185.1 serine/threonine protein kinase [Streptomyces pactum]